MLNRKSLLPLNKIGIVAFCIYIFMSYNAINIIIPSTFSQLAMYLFLGVGALSISNGIGHIKISKFMAWYLVLMAYSLLTMLYSKEKNILDSQFYFMIISVIISFFALNFIKAERHLSIVFWAFSLSSFFLCIVLTANGLLIGDAGNRLGEELFGNANTFAYMIMLATFCQIWLLVYNSKILLSKIILLAALIINIYALSLSGGRKYFVIPFVFLYILMLMKKDKRGRKHTIKNTLIVGAVIFLVYYLVMNVDVLYNGVGIRLERLIEGYAGEGRLDNSADLRKRMQIAALKGWLNSPLFGNGFDSFKYYSRDAFGTFAYSHCNFTELLHNGGIVGFLIYYYYYFYIFKKAINNKSVQTKYRAFAIALIISILIFEYGAVTYSTTLLILFIGLLEKITIFEKEKEFCK